MKTFAFAAVIAATSAIATNDLEFINYIARHNKMYNTTEEFEFRQQVWSEKHEFINQHNAEGNTWELGHNQFSDWTPEEYSTILGYKPELRTSDVNVSVAEYTVGDSVAIDWRTKGAVTPVKNQGSCGSCWSFSTTGALEGAHQIKTGTLVSYSEQQFVDCDYGLRKNMGCNGGLMDKAFTYAETNAIATEGDYAYTGKKASCNTADLANAALKVTSFEDVKTNDPAALKAQLAKGPVSVAIEADKMVFQMYKKGVITGTKCGTSLDHGVLAVGWGTSDADGEYYIVKNSWAATWGDEGYVNIGVADGAGVCGIQSGPPSQPVTN